jgi:Ca2+:H+ antiporter
LVRPWEATAYSGPEPGGGWLLNATFGNAAELIIALAALRAGFHDVLKASIAGSIVGNVLLVLGASMLAGGWRRSEATMLTLAAIALVLPAAYRSLLGEVDFRPMHACLWPST